MFCLLRKKKIYPAYISKYNWNLEKQVIFLMIPNREGWHYFAVKKLSALLRGTISKNNVDFYCFNCLHSFRTKNKLEWRKKLCEKNGVKNKFNQYQKSDKVPFVIFANLECLIEKIKNNSENSSTTKVGQHIRSGFSMSTISSFKGIEVYRGKDCMKKFCEYLREHALKIINFKAKKMKLLTKQQ